MPQFIRNCKPGDQVRLQGETLVATVVRITPSRAYVRLDKGGVNVTVQGRTFRATQSQYVDWSTGTRVEVLQDPSTRKVRFWPLVDSDAEPMLGSPTVKHYPGGFWPLVKEDVMGILKVSSQDKEQENPRPMRLLERKKLAAVSPKIQKLQQRAAERKEEGKPVGKVERKRVVRAEARKAKVRAKTALRAAEGKPAGGRCQCGCNTRTLREKSSFLRGHYGRYIGMLKQVASGDLQWDELPKLVRADLKTLVQLRTTVAEHDKKEAATKRRGGSTKTKWLRKRLKKPASAKDPKTVQAYRKHGISSKPAKLKR